MAGNKGRQRRKQGKPVKKQLQDRKVVLVKPTSDTTKEEVIETGLLTKKELKKQKKALKKAEHRKEKLRGLKISFLVLFTLIAVVVLLAFFAARWVLTYWDGLTMEELLYTATNTTDGTESSIILAGVKGIGIPILCVIVSFVILDIFAVKKKHYFLLAGAYLISALGFGFYTKDYVYDKLDVEEYVAESTTESEFIESNYVDPSSVDLTFPEEKRNLIYIYMESMEVAYSDTTNGGAFENNYIPELTQLAEQYEDFSGSQATLNGAYSTTYTTWTMGGIFAATSGLPLKTNINNNDMDTMSSFFPGITTLGNILEDNGYHNEFLCGSDVSFGGRELYFTEHGNYTLDDYYSAIEEGVIPSWYKVWWGYEDQILFERAKEKITALAQSDEPFNFTILTVDTHKEDGYYCDICNWQYDDQYANVIACSSRQVTEFVNWCMEQDWYDNTTIVLSGDHPTMDSDFCSDVAEDYPRKVYTCYINSVAEVRNSSKKREYCTYDNFPTTLAAIGVEIDGNRLGLGTNLYSSEKTLVEEYGIDELNSELSHKSVFMENLADIDWDSEELLAEEGDPTAGLKEYEYDAETQTVSIRVGEFKRVGTQFESVVLQLTNDSGITEVFPLTLVEDDTETMYEGTLDVSDFVVDGTPQYNIALIVTNKNGKKIRLFESSFANMNKPYGTMAEFLRWVRIHPNYVLLGSIKGDLFFELPSSAVYNMNQIGMDYLYNELQSRSEKSWYGIYNSWGDGSMIQYKAYYYLSTWGSIYDGSYYYIISAEVDSGDDAYIYINGVDYSRHETGYNFVVYDTSTHQVVDTVAFHGNMFMPD